jgi:hypothetical protein
MRVTFPSRLILALIIPILSSQAWKQGYFYHAGIAGLLLITFSS